MPVPGLETANVLADDIGFEAGGEAVHFKGYVDLKDSRRNLRLQADDLIINTSDHTFEATGNVAFEQGGILINGSRMTGNLDKATGAIDNASGVAPGNIYFRGDRIIQLEQGVYKIEKGVITPCKQSLAIWEFNARTVKLVPGSHAIMTWPSFKVKGVPILVLPALYWPLDEEGRSTGFLLPNIGSSTNRGFQFSESFFWAIARTADATFSFDHFSLAGNGLGGEFRHRFFPGSQGSFRFFRLGGTSPEKVKSARRAVPGGWSVDGSHQQLLPGKFRLNATANFFTSTDFVRGFDDDFNRFLRRTSSIGVFLTRSWDVYNLNIDADSSRTFFGRDSVVRQRLPEVEFRMRRKPIAGPLHLAFQGSAARLARREDRQEDQLGGTFTRLDSFPELSLQFTSIPWLTFSPFVNWRTTYYTDRAVGSDFEPRSITRNLYATGIEIIGPSTFRIYDKPQSTYSPRYKHVIEPRITWSRTDEVDPSSGRIIQFDEIDPLGGKRNRMRLSVINRLLAKRFPSRNAEERTTWEVLSVEFARDIDLRSKPPGRDFPTIPLPYSLTGRLTPTEHVNFSGGAQFTPNFAFGGYNISGNLNYGNNSANLAWFRTASPFPDPDNPSKVRVRGFNRLTGGGTLNLLDQAVTIRGHTSFDISRRDLQEVSYATQYNTQCCSIGGEIRRISFGFRSETQFSFILELLNVGSFGFGDQRR